jgi:NADH-ubiquinone oxidoreductase chain 1
MTSCFILILGVILSVALMTLADRKTMGAMQRRIGPNKVGYLGILQPFADGIKLILKETVLPYNSNI